MIEIKRDKKEVSVLISGKDATVLVDDGSCPILAECDLAALANESSHAFPDKDFTFSEITPFGNHRHYGLQAKAGDISGNVNGAIDELLGQLADAFQMPYCELGSKEQRYISTFIIAISGVFKENASEKIIEKMPKGCIGSVYFLDRERITELVERYWKTTKA